MRGSPTNEASKRGPLRRVAAAVGAGILALLLNLVLFQSILFLNRAAAAKADEQPLVMRSQRVELPPLIEPEPIEDLELPAPEQPQLTIDLDTALPTLEPLELPEFELDLQLAPPSFAGATVQVRRRTQVHAETPTATGPQGNGGEPLDSNQVDEPPRELASSAKPIYPRAAQRRRIQGRVTIELLIDERGRVTAQRGARGEPLLVEAVVAILPKLRFAPARNGGQAVPVWGRKTFRFELPRRR